MRCDSHINAVVILELAQFEGTKTIASAVILVYCYRFCKNIQKPIAGTIIAILP